MFQLLKRLRENNIIKNLKIIGGCPGNTVGVAELVKNRKVEDVIKLLKNILTIKINNARIIV